MGLYSRWIVANALSEGLGLGLSLVLGFVAATQMGEVDTPATVLGGALLAVFLGTLLEGVLVGAAQAWALRDALPISARRWVTATAAGAGIAWALGMIPSSVMALLAPPAPETEEVWEPSTALVMGMAALMGMVLGPILGLAQWVELRRHVDRAWRWLIANALAWAAGMVVIFAGMDLVPWEGAPVLAGLGVLGVCVLAGAVVGAIHGRLIVRLVPRR